MPQDVRTTSSMFDTWIARYHALPRAGRWLTWFIAALVLFFAVIEPMLRLTAHFNVEADSTLRSIEKYAHTDKQIAGTIETGRARWGDVLPPTSDSSRILDAKDEITAILAKNGITREVTMIERPPTRVKTDQAPKGIQYMRGPIEVKFTARPHVAAAVLADIEASPQVAMVSSVRLRRLPDRAEIEATIVADAWYTMK